MLTMIEPNTDLLTVLFIALIVIVPATLHALFGESEGWYR